MVMTKQRMLVIILAISLALNVFFCIKLHRCWHETYDKSADELQTPVTALEKEYSKEIAEAQDRSQMCTINQRYTAKWEQMIEEYYNKLLSVGTINLSESVTKSQQSWEAYKEAALQEMDQYLTHVYTTGTAPTTLYTKFEYDINKERAETLYKIYIEIDEVRISLEGESVIPYPWNETL